MRASPKIAPAPSGPKVSGVIFEPFELKVCEAWNHGLDRGEIAAQFDLSPRCVQKLLDRLRQAGRTLRRCYGHDANASKLRGRVSAPARADAGVVTRIIGGVPISLARVPSLERPL